MGRKRLHGRSPRALHVGIHPVSGSEREGEGFDAELSRSAPSLDRPVKGGGGDASPYDRRSLPLWLRRLSRVKAELKGTRWPGPEKGFHQGIALMAWGLKALEGEMQSKTSMGHSDQVQKHILAAFARADLQWIARWRKERAKVFPR